MDVMVSLARLLWLHRCPGKQPSLWRHGPESGSPAGQLLTGTSGDLQTKQQVEEPLDYSFRTLPDVLITAAVPVNTHYFHHLFLTKHGCTGQVNYLLLKL